MHTRAAPGNDAPRRPAEAAATRSSPSGYVQAGSLHTILRMMYRCFLFVWAASACDSPVALDEKTSELSGASTIVSLTFDDTLADQYQVGAIAEARGMRAVFYINSPRLDTAGYLTRAQAIDLQIRGHEIGGHTLSHVHLPAVPEDEARAQICNDRAALLDGGFAVTSFAYPFGDDSAAVQRIVDDCDYNNARDVGGLQSPTCPSCPWSNPVPPANVFQIRTYDSVQTDTPLAAIQQQVLDAEQHGGGYVPIVFHHVCDGCDSNAVSPAVLAQFLDWLAARAPSTQVATVQEAIGGGVQPAMRYPDPNSGANLARNPSLEADADTNQVPDCWQRGGFGTNTATYTLVSDASDGVRAQQITITSLSSGGRRLVTAQDTGVCAPPVTAGHSYRITAFYKSDVQPRLTVYYRNASGAWGWFAESALLPTSATYRQATYTTPAIPSGATAISFGLGIFAVGTITIDQHTLVDTTSTPPADTVVPLLFTACNGNTCSTSPYPGPVRIGLTANDAGSGIREIRYTIDGSDPTTGALYAGGFTINSSATVRAIAVDNAGNRTFRTTQVTIAPPDTTPPALAIACNGAPCSTTAYAAPVTISLSATDPGSGVREIRYTTDGSDPTAGTVYTGPFTISTTTTVRSTAIDNAGNQTFLSTPVTIAPASDTTPPSLAIACDSTTCSSEMYPMPVKVTLTAADSGSGVREIRYTTDGSDPTLGVLYTGPFTLSSSATVRATAVDNAENRTFLTQQVTIAPASDNTPPALSIACNSAACSSAAYPGPVTVTLMASDTGSGVGEVRYTTDGSDPTTGILYTGPFTVSSSAMVRATAVDNAGNRTFLTQQITVAPADTTPPSLSIACNGAPCSTATYSGPVTVTLAASDTGSGLREIRYTTDGSDPATGTLYSSAFTVSSSATVRSTALDNAGNRTSMITPIAIASAPVNLLQNPSLEADANGDQVPDCWKRDGYGTNTAVFSLVAGAFDGARAQQLQITSWTSGGRRLASAQDAGTCAPAATAGRQYTMTAYYKATIQPRFSVYYRNASGSWQYLAESAPLPTSSTYRQATYTSPPLPTGATAISIGVSIFGVGTLTTDMYTLVQAP